MQITTAIETIDVKRAEQLLATLSKKQRLLKKHHVNFLRSELEGGYWELNGETIKITPEGKLIDGQHRLAAVMNSGVPLQTVVVFGVDENVYNSIDSGLRRNVADSLYAKGEKNYTILAAAIGICNTVDTTKRYNYSSYLLSRIRSSTISHEYLSKNGKLRDSVTLASQHYTRLLHPSMMAALHYLYLKRKANREVMDQFVIGLKEGYLQVKYPNFHLFRENLIANLTNVARVRRNVIFAWAVIAINATLAGEKLKEIKWSKQDDLTIIRVP